MYKILVVGPSWVGDTVLAQPLFKRLHDQHPGLALDVLAPAWTLPLLARMAEVREAVASPFGHGDLRLVERWRLARRLAGARYDQAIVLPNSWKSALVPWLAGIPLRTGFVGELRYLLLNDARTLDAGRLPLMAERFAALAETRNAAPRTPLAAPALRVDPQRRALTLERLGLALDRPVACLCPGAEYGPAKRWPAAYFAQLAERLRGARYQVWLIGSARDREIGDEILRAAPDCALNLCGRSALDDAIDLLSCAALVVSNDSGLMHVAAALGKPLFALYGSSSPGFTPPMSERATILKLDLPCSPCYKRRCPLGHFDCMRRLDAERVWQAIQSAAPPRDPRP